VIVQDPTAESIWPARVLSRAPVPSSGERRAYRFSDPVYRGRGASCGVSLLTRDEQLTPKSLERPWSRLPYLPPGGDVERKYLSSIEAKPAHPYTINSF
jgi:hypothetical protein